MVSIDIPASNYAKFAHKGEVKRLDNTVNYIYSSWLHTSGPVLEVYGREYVPVSENSVMYYAIPIEH